ncbi:MAG TPA: hypothetical protein VMU02_01280 [bacterium]|nr:hypothetical protein [bacterium]
MRRAFVMACVGIAILAGIAVESGYAEGSATFQLSLFPPVQLRDENLSISLLRLDLIYGRNVSVHGLDLGLINHCTGGTSVGLQYGIVGYVGGSFVGWQANTIDIVKQRFSGFQSGFYNQMNNGEAVQYGIFNVATDVTGLQLGFINYTQKMYGLQIGLINVIRQKEKLPVLPIINWSF